MNYLFKRFVQNTDLEKKQRSDCLHPKSHTFLVRNCFRQAITHIVLMCVV